MKEEKIQVLALLPMELPKEIDLDNTLEAMQNFVGGLIEFKDFTKAAAHSAVEKMVPGCFICSLHSF